MQQTKPYVHNSITSGNESKKVGDEDNENNEGKHDYGNKNDRQASTKRTSIEDTAPSHPLFSHGMCRWTGCELAGFKNLEAFKDHLTRDHVLDERSTAQTRVQVSIILLLLNHLMIVK